MITSIAASPDIWVLRTHAPGDNDQSLALAEALGAPFAVMPVDWPAADPDADRATLRGFLAKSDAAVARRAAAGLRAPWPRQVICCGSRADRIGFWIKRQSGGRTKVVSIGRAHQPVASYDLLAATPQFAVPARSNVVHLKLPLGRRRAHARGQHQNAVPGVRLGGNMVPVPKPWFTLLLGGEAKEYIIAPETLERAARAAQEAADRHGGTVVVSTSRRTSPEMLAIVERVLTRPYVYRWSAAARHENPYELLLQHSAALFVTADSASMVLDACQSGTPTYVVEYPARMDLRRRLRREVYQAIRAAVWRFRRWGLGRAAQWLDRAQESLHAAGLLRYPRDLTRLHASIFELNLARRMIEFDPAKLPARAQIANDFGELSGLSRLAARCRAL